MVPLFFIYFLYLSELAGLLSDFSLFYFFFCKNVSLGFILFSLVVVGGSVPFKL